MARHFKNADIHLKNNIGLGITGELSNHQRESKPHDLTQGASRQGARVTRLHRRRGGENSDEGDRLQWLSSHGLALSMPMPAVSKASPPDSGVVPFSEEEPPPIKSGKPILWPSQ